jgi:heme/copper-type cytochrome/quinol oxidase subunit 2
MELPVRKSAAGQREVTIQINYLIASKKLSWIHNYWIIIIIIIFIIIIILPAFILKH